MSDLPSIADRVAAGVAWLDEHDPGWWRADAPARPENPSSRPIDLKRLQMANPCGCVLGHRYGSYYSSPVSVTFDGWTLGFDHGPGEIGTTDFDHERWEAEWSELADCWSWVIEQRRAEVAADA